MSMGTGVVQAVRSNHSLDEPTTRFVVDRAQTSSKHSVEAERRHFPWLDGYLEWLDGKEVREEYYGLLERMSGR
jgi:hypothetical protein